MIVIYTTVSNVEQAESIAQTLISERLVACVNMWPMNSMYMWNQKLEKSSEIAMLLKTANHDAVYQCLLDIHPYECPAIITVDSRANPAFEQWVRLQTQC